MQTSKTTKTSTQHHRRRKHTKTSTPSKTNVERLRWRPAKRSHTAAASWHGLHCTIARDGAMRAKPLSNFVPKRRDPFHRMSAAAWGWAKKKWGFESRKLKHSGIFGWSCDVTRFFFVALVPQAHPCVIVRYLI